MAFDKPTDSGTLSGLRLPAWLPGWRTAAAVASGLLLAAAFPPFEAAGLAWVALVPLLLALIGVSPREGARLGWIAGLTFWVIGLGWMLRLLETSPAPFLLVLLGWGLLVAYCAAYVAAFGLIFAWLAATIGTTRFWQTLLLMGLATATWVGGEYARGILGGGFPWNGLGVSQFRNLGLIQCAAWGGVAAVSAVLVLANAGIAFTVRRYLPGPGRQAYRPHIELFAGLLATLLCYRFGFTSMREYAALPTTLEIAAVQPAIAQMKKWDEGESQRILARLRTLTDEAAEAEPKPDLIVWPETATPDCVTVEGESQALVKDMARHGVPLLVGTMDVIDNGRDDLLCYNAAILFDAHGRPAGRYDKQHLVPFGEYVPLSGLIPALAKLAPMGWNCSAGHSSTVLEVGKPPVPFSCLICFEDILPDLARTAVRKGARLLINQSNDAWFDRTGGPLQHASHSVFRAVENRVSLVRVTNSGITCLIEPNGALEEETANAWGLTPGPLVRRLSVGVPGPEWKPTFYTRHGDLPFAVPCAGIAALGFVLALAACRREKGGRVGGLGPNPDVARASCP